MNSGNFVFGDKTDWEVTGPGVKRQILAYDDQIMVVKVCFEAGSEGYVHAHPHRQCTYVVDGVFEFQVGEKKNTVRAGDSLYMQPDVPHGVICIEAGTLIDTFNPVRKDFLK